MNQTFLIMRLSFSILVSSNIDIDPILHTALPKNRVNLFGRNPMRQQSIFVLNSFPMDQQRLLFKYFPEKISHTHGRNDPLENLFTCFAAVNNITLKAVFYLC